MMQHRTHKLTNMFKLRLSFRLAEKKNILKFLYPKTTVKWIIN